MDKEIKVEGRKRGSTVATIIAAVIIVGVAVTFLGPLVIRYWQWGLGG